jgi:hypothetical protein
MRRLSIICTATLALPAPTALAHWSWSASGSVPGAVTALSCPSATLCVAVAAGRAYVGPAAWRPVPAPPGTSFTALSCASVAFCALADTRGDVLSSVDPAGAGAWTSSSSGASLRALACPSGSLCAALDNSGNALVSLDPGSSEASWFASPLTTLTGRPEYSVACAGGAFCAGVYTTPIVSFTTDPGALAPNWQPEKLNGPPLRAIACPSASLCVAVGGWRPGHGRVVFSPAPAGGAGAWRSLDSATGTLDAVACSGVSLCAAVGGGWVVSSRRPLSSWARSAVPVRGWSGTAVSCPTPHLCLAGSSTGAIMTGRM